MSWRNSSVRGRGNDGRRGAHRGRGARSGRDSRSSPDPPVGKLVKTIPSKKAGAVAPDDQAHCGISNVELVASYNWIDSPDAKIVSPGKPALWTPPEGPQKLRGDRGVFYRDRNAASYPSHPMEPAVVSVLRMHPEPLSVDIVGCSSTLDDLLCYVRGEGRSFRMLVEVVGQTMHLIRRENSPTYGTRGTSYGRAFLDAYTSWEPGFGRSLSHQRILRYRLGGLDVLLRYEADGYVGAGQRTRAAAGEDTADASGRMGSLRLHQDGSSMVSRDKGLQVASAGSPTPQDSVMDIKTRSIRSKDLNLLSKQMPRLWVRQVPKLVLALHTEGLFDDVKVHDVSAAFEEWEAKNQAHLRQLVALLRRLARDAMADRHGKLELVGKKGGELELRTRLPDAGTVFSPSVGLQWEHWLGEGRKKGAARGFASESLGGWGDDKGGQHLTACDRDCGYCGECMY